MSRVPFDHIPIDESFEPMVRLQDRNLFGVPVYFHHGWAASPDLWLRRGLADRLENLQARALLPLGLAWVIYDGWRPREVQATIYRHYWQAFSTQHPAWSVEQLRQHVATFVTVPANPERVPPHSTGGSVDLGLFDVERNVLLDCGSDFDEFSPRAAQAFFETQPPEFRPYRNRRRLIASVLSQQDIVSDADEWFHKDFGNQKWAWQSGRPSAPYGEVLDCLPCESGGVTSRWGAEESAEQKYERIKDLLSRVDIRNSAKEGSSTLQSPRSLVTQEAARQDVLLQRLRSHVKKGAALRAEPPRSAA